MKPLRFVTVGSLAVCLLSPSYASAQASSSEKALASRLFDEAGALMSAGKFSDACAKYGESQRLDPELGTLLHLGECYVKAGMTATAWTTFREAADIAGQRNDAREKKIRERVASLEKNLSNLVIVVPAGEPAGLEIRQDDAVLGKPAWGSPIPIDPGVHKVTATAPGAKPRELTATIGDKAQTVTVTLPPIEYLPAAPVAVAAPGTQAATPASQPAAAPADNAPWLPAHQRAVAAVVGGVGVVGVGLGTFFGLASKSKHDDATKYCSSVSCNDPRGVDAGKDARTDGNISTVMMIVGGVGLAAGVTLWFTAPKKESAASAQLNVGPGSIQMKAVW